MNDDELKRLRELAEKATPGPWREWGNEQGHFGDLRPVVAQAPGDGTIHKILSIFSFEHRQGNAAFIAAANPQTILSLLDQLSSTQHRLREREEECEGLRAQWDSGVGELTKASYAQVALVTQRLHETESQLATITRERDTARQALTLAAEKGVAAGKLVGEVELEAMTRARDEACAGWENLLDEPDHRFEAEQRADIERLRRVGKEGK